MNNFPGFDGAINMRKWTEVVHIPDRIYSIDGKRFVSVDLDSMAVPSDERGETVLKLTEKLASFSRLTRLSAIFVLLEALDGKRKTSTVYRWLSELSLFARTVSAAMNEQRISIITLKMYLWYCSKKQASQEKLLRSALLRWIDEDAPGLHPELIAHIKSTSPRQARGMIEVQNAVPSERPFSMNQVGELLESIDELFQSGEFDPQDNLLWRLMISEALRPSQMALLQLGDVAIDRNGDGRPVAVRLWVPLVKQSGVAARDYMREHRLSPSVGQAMSDHLDYVEAVCGRTLPARTPIFCVVKNARREARIVDRARIHIHHIINHTRRKITTLNDNYQSTDLFNRRFKHTKLTQLAAAGAPLEVLAFAGFQTSTVSLQRYVNLSEEAFGEYELLLDPANQAIENAFRGKVIKRGQASFSDSEHRIVDATLKDALGACSVEPCGILACLGCYVCSKFEAFEDGPHASVEEMLIAQRERAVDGGLPSKTVQMRDRLISAVQQVIRLSKSTNV